MVGKGRDLSAFQFSSTKTYSEIRVLKELIAQKIAGHDTLRLVARVLMQPGLPGMVLVSTFSPSALVTQESVSDGETNGIYSLALTVSPSKMQQQGCWCCQEISSKPFRNGSSVHAIPAPKGTQQLCSARCKPAPPPPFSLRTSE